jgi:hypothetical protein
VSEELAGWRVRCPSCRAVVPVPAFSAQPRPRPKYVRPPPPPPPPPTPLSRAADAVAIAGFVVFGTAGLWLLAQFLPIAHATAQRIHQAP